MSTWEHEALVGRFETGSKAEIRVEVMARDGKGYIQFTQRRYRPAGYWEAWQELLIPLEKAGEFMAWTDKAADQCETLPGVESALPALLPAGAPEYAVVLPVVQTTQLDEVTEEEWEATEQMFR